MNKKNGIAEQPPYPIEAPFHKITYHIEMNKL